MRRVKEGRTRLGREEETGEAWVTLHALIRGVDGEVGVRGERGGECGEVESAFLEEARVEMVFFLE